ncbi:MAG: endoflagellar protein [Acidaminobacter sp.]|uniref:flagellar FlbD family protein n=1 Tax=Acidaminobacter sp. TaxID=1872102 RepID=UPI001382836C|nr:flagellar FlbD family protein [Acidaminobacter sp.]MZQ99594.1 endoflagellar protein [Acidaminobacter sp.]
MIRLTSLKGETFYLNEILVYRIDQVPDTLITLTDGNKLRVSETPDDVVDKIRDYQKSVGVMFKVIRTEATT